MTQRLTISAEVPHNVNENLQRWVFALLCAIMAIVNFDSGAIAASLDLIKKEFGLTDITLGLLGSLPYVALTVMSPVSGFYLTKFSPKRMIGIGLVINIGSNALMAVSHRTILLCVSRFFVGLTQASFLIYAPVWVEEFAPIRWKTCWVALLQASVPIGIDLGYIVAGLLTCNGVIWQISVWVQVVTMTPLVVIYFFIPSSSINVADCAQTGSRLWNPNEARTSIFLPTTPTNDAICIKSSGRMGCSTPLASAAAPAGGPSPKNHRGLREARQLSARTSIHPFTMPQIQKSTRAIKSLLNGVYLSTIFALCALFFVVNGMQYWCTIWLQNDFRGDMDPVDFKKTMWIWRNDGTKNASWFWSSSRIIMVCTLFWWCNRAR